MQFIIALCNSRIFTGHFTESKTNCDSQRNLLEQRLFVFLYVSVLCHCCCILSDCILTLCHKCVVWHTHLYTRTPNQSSYMRENKMLGIHLQLTCPFVMLIRQITQHHSKLNGWLITLKLQASCSLDVSEASADVSIFPSPFSGRFLIDRQEFNQNLITKGRNSTSNRFECSGGSLVFSSLIQTRYWWKVKTFARGAGEASKR